MKVGLLGTDFHSANRGCGALAYGAVEILRNVYRQKEEPLELYAILFMAEPLPQVAEDVTIQCIKIEPKKFSYWKKCVNIFKECDVILDFTGGDSFSDLYGLKRFCIASMLKELAIKSPAKFVMAPQTIGPFKGWFARRWARRIMKKSDVCFTRDTMSQKYSEENFDVKPLLTTDVAFALPYESHESERSGKIRIGFNPSGLLWDGTKAFQANKHITVDYKKYVHEIMNFLCGNDMYEVHLIPHVFTLDGGGKENDMMACKEIHELYPQTLIDCAHNTPMEAKGLISTMDLFIGARMHATIAAFSSGVATIPLSYSRKFEGLYFDLNYNYIISATSVDTEEAISKTIEWIKHIDELKKQVKLSGELLEEKQKVFTDKLMDIT